MDSVFNNTLIWVLSMIHSLVFSVWISTLSLKDQEVELGLEEDVKAESEPNIESANNKLCNGSRRNTMELSITDLYRIFKLYSISYNCLSKYLYLSIFIKYSERKGYIQDCDYCCR